ncbi:hypothetical protein PG994_005421 [Apiospora phragmitis]|uniref:Uncharacterized protein n=1 Tax=Apiospora phragmitis TaxID=2905665 RepID=A0ABR1VC86_9PEZI
MAGSNTIVLRKAKAHQDAAKKSLAFRRFLLLAKMAEDAGLCPQDVRLVLSKFYQWLEPAGRANLAKFAGHSIGHVAWTVGADPKPLYEARQGGRDCELRHSILRGAVDEVLRDPLQLYGAQQGWFLHFVGWLKWGQSLELAVLEPAMYAILMAHQLLANPDLKLPKLGGLRSTWSPSSSSRPVLAPRLRRRSERSSTRVRDRR